MRTVGLVILSLIIFLVSPSLLAQRGKIIRSASTTVMDPNQDGFISKTTAGFSNDGYNVDEFEITMFGIPQLGGDVTGDNIGNSCGITDLTPDNKGYSTYAVRDAANNLIFRFRVGDDNPSVESWTILLDTDGLFGDEDPNSTPENPGFEIDITLIKRNNAGVYVYNIDGIENCPNELLFYSINSNFQISIADEVTCGDPDYFYDYYVPFAQIASAFGININTGVRYVAVTNVSATCAMAGQIADVSGVDNTDPEYANCISCAFEDLVANQCPTAFIDLCETCNGFAQDLVEAPTIDEPLRAGQTVVSGTCQEDIFIVLKAFPRIGGTDASPIWSTTPRETQATYAIGTNWSVTLTMPLVAYDKIVARAQADEFSVPCGGDDDESSSTSITVVAPNTKPFATDQNVTVTEDTPKAIVLTGTDPENDPITFTIVTPPSHGALSGTAPNVTYTPNLNYNGADSFTFRTNDGIYNSDVPGTVTITVTPVNDPPIANNQSVTVTEDVAKAITLTGTDVDGNALTYTIVTPPANGVLTGAAPNVTYTPNLNYNGSDSFTFKVNDGSVDSNIATVSLTITPVADAPIANNQNVTVTEDVAKTITLTGSDPDGSAITYIVVAAPTHGTLSGTAPNLTYTPALNYNGADSFTFKVNDGTSDSNTATVSITVTPVNDSPIANNQSATTAEDIAKAITLTGSDIDGNALTYIVVTPPSHGVLSGAAPNLTYTPGLNYNGSDSFTFKVNDGTIDSNIATVSITVTPVSDPPIANNQNVTVVEDVGKAITLTGTDPDGDAITYIVMAAPTHGTLSGSAPNVTYTPDLNYNGGDSFTFKVNDGGADSNIATVTITVTPTNDSPIANSQNVTYDLNTDKAITLTGSDPDGDPLTYIVLTLPTNGVLTGTAPNLTYTPNLSFSGSDSFSFRVNDGTANSNIATVSLNLTPVINNNPVANDQSIFLQEDVPTGIILSATDIDGDALTYIIASAPLHGILTGAGANRTYTPALNYAGPDSFTFKVNDGSVDSNIATVSITVTPINDVPVANNQSVTTLEDVAKTIVLTGSDAEGSTLTFTIVSPPTHGSLSGSGANVTYTPVSNYNGSDSFTFNVNDGTNDSNTATVSITISPLQDAPVASNANVIVIEDTPKGIMLVGTDADGNSLTYSLQSAPTHGILSGTAPNLTYTPDLNYNGADSFTFSVNDGTIDSNIATISIDVTPVNDLPIADAQSATTPEEIAKAITLAGNDVEGSGLTFSISTPPTHGTLSGTGANITYTPTAGYNGSDNFEFTVNDGSADSDPATVTITVTPVNDVPVATDQNVTTQEDVAKAITLVGSDIDGDAITYLVVLNPTNGVLTGTAPNLTYTPTSDFNGSDSFTFRVNDGSVNSNVATVSITVTPVNDPLVANNQNISTPEDIALNITLTGNNPDGGTLTFSLASLPTHGSLTGSGANLTYTPVLNYSGNDSFTFKINNGITESNMATISIAVTPVNDAPQITELPVLTTKEDSLLQVCLNVVDVENDAISYEPSINIKGGGTMVQDVAPFDFCYTFTAPLNYNGESVWDLLVRDAGGLPASVSAKIILIPVNDQPVAFDDIREAQSGAQIIFKDLLDNDLPIEAPFDEFYDIYADSTDSLSFDHVLTFNGAVATITSWGFISYTPNREFQGTDSLRYWIRDRGNLIDSALVTIEVGPPPFHVYNAVSPDDNGLNDYWRIDGIEQYPKNLIRIFDRFNNLVYETNGYVNKTASETTKANYWYGQSNHGLAKNALPEGTYFYSIQLGDGSDPLGGFIVLKRK